MLGNAFGRVTGILFVGAWNLSSWKAWISRARLEFLMKVLLNILVFCRIPPYIPTRRRYHSLSKRL